MKILVSDFDNTFYTEDIKENVRLIDDFRDRGNIFVIATGRPLYLLKPDIEKYNIKYDYLICNDGAVIFDHLNNVINKTNIDYQTTVQIYNLLKRNINIKHVYVDGINDFSDLDAKDFNGILALPYDRELVKNILDDITNKFTTVQGYLSHKWLNILSCDASKGNAIKFLQNNNSWNDDDIYVVGDNHNDTSMTVFKNSYAVLYGEKNFIDKCNYKIRKFSDLMEKL